VHEQASSADENEGVVIDTRKLRMLAELDRRGTIAAVADELRLTASGVSMQLAALERELGVALTERTGRRLALTPAGALLARHGHDILDRLSLAELDLDALRRGTVGRYAVAAFPSAARTFVADTWRRIVDEGLGLELRLTTLEPDEALDALGAGRADLAVIHSYSNVARDLPSGIDAHPLATEPVRLACRIDDPAYDGGGLADLGAFAEHPWIGASAGLSCAEMTDRACGRAGFRPRLVAESSDFAVQLELVAAGAGVALVPDLTIETVPAGVALRPLADAVERSFFVAARRASATDAGIRTIAERLRETALARVAAPRPA
jgi:DNA-binding transcriptional LysR family regulator